jgi:pimeloyl-ACP methyl ester carboxylesterase
MSEDSDLNKRGNHAGEFTQGVGGWAEYTVYFTPISDTVRHDVTVPPGKVIPVIFLPGVMGSNLRMSRKRQPKLDRKDNRSWRPDDLVSLSGKAEIARSKGFGGWFRDATPAQRQLDFDPNETEVEYYHYTENNDRFDPEGKDTLASDARHQNVPDSLAPIPPLIGQRISKSVAAVPRGRGVERKRESPAQIARWRGWSEVLFTGAYGQMLKTAEMFLNNMMVGGKIHPCWQLPSTETPSGATVLPVPHPEITHLLRQDPRVFGGSGGEPISDADIKKLSMCWYPVHAMGYNFLKSNGDSAVAIAERIRGLVKGYQHRGFKCDEVVIVTHSMGGLVARALIHPSYGNLLNDEHLKVLGMYHNVMPTIGAASAYKRMRFGFQEKEGYVAELEASVLALDGINATAILANTPAPLEMLPGAAYGRDWLKVVDGTGKTMWSWPRGAATALDSIYLKPNKAWWRLVNPQWVNPGNVSSQNGGGLKNVYKRIEDAAKFLHSIEETFHPTSCYASYCASDGHLSYGEVVFKAEDHAGMMVVDTPQSPIPPPESWQLLTDNAKNTLTVQAGSRVLTLKLQPPSAPGDETVPSQRSAQHVSGTRFVHGGPQGRGYEHQGSYSDPQVLASMLYSIVQIAKTAKWE